MTSPDAKPPVARPILTTHPLLGIAGVLLGAMIATCTGRLMSVGLADIRGALHLGVDEASWINTSFNASMMFIGPFSVYLGGLLGPRRVLLACAWSFTAVSFLITFWWGLQCMRRTSSSRRIWRRHGSPSLWTTSRGVGSSGTGPLLLL